MRHMCNEQSCVVNVEKRVPGRGKQQSCPRVRAPIMIGTVKAEPRSDSHCPPSKNQIPGHLDSSQVGRTDNTGLLLRTKRRTHSYSRRGRTGALSRPSGVDMSLRYVHRLDGIAEKGLYSYHGMSYFSESLRGVTPTAVSIWPDDSPSPWLPLAAG